MKKLLTFLFIFGMILYLKPGFRFPNGSESMRIKYVQGEGVVASVGQQGRLAKIVGEDGKRYYVPIDNILYIIEE